MGRALLLVSGPFGVPIRGNIRCPVSICQPCPFRHRAGRAATDGPSWRRPNITSSAMRICWFNDNRLGLVRDGRVLDVSDALKALPPPAYPAPRGDPLITHLDKVRPAIEQAAKGAKSHAIA